MSRPVKFGLILVALACLASLPVAYRHRHSLHNLLHKIRHSLLGNAGAGGNKSSIAFVPPPTLEIAGKQYKNVLGYPPYYLTVTQFDAALFVTRVDDAGHNLIHLMSLKSGQEEEIPTRVDFGRNIGATGGGFRDYVQGANSNEVTVASEVNVGRAMKTVYHLNLRSAMVDTRDVFYYDANGRITNSASGPGF